MGVVRLASPPPPPKKENKMIITKIKIHPDRPDTTICYTISNARDSKEVTFNCVDLPSEEWKNCLQVLKDFVCEVLELPYEYGNSMTITGLTIKHEEAGCGYVISAQKKLDDIPAPLCLNTPYLAPARNENSSSVVDYETEISIDKIVKMAIEFLEGKHRAQQEMF